MKRFILTAVSFMTLLCSCENFIDLQPMDKITMMIIGALRQSWNIIRGNSIHHFVLGHRWLRRWHRLMMI